MTVAPPVTKPQAAADAYHGKSNWLAADMADTREWIIQLSPEKIADLDHALQEAKNAGISIDKLTKQNFPLTVFDKIVPEIQDRLENGRGIVVLRGLPAQKYSRDDLRLLYWGMGLYLGTAVSQSSKGDLLGDVRNFGQDVNSATGRGYMSKQGLGFHTDTADVVALIVMRTAKSGGRSMICSSVAIRNEIAATRPDLLDVLYQPFYWSWKGQEAPGEMSYYQQPIYSEHDGKFACRHIATHILAAHENFKELGPLPEKQLEAIKLVNKLANDERFHFGMMFEPGDIQLLNNHVTYHARTEFEDYPEDDRKRHLLRMWLSMPNTRGLSPQMAPIYQDQRPGVVRGGFPSRTGKYSFETVQAQD
ncbi:TauD/TfdA family dioxygenase [Polaromonas sp. SM01]|uniref:TauD/TfdA family dioxygenase n=1 Tax=Polaromonas sp. SM01 TaxID=3085630 RepID=UPI0029823D32|nr:TauD/TfdA family dioxygenase [Polaromonas sp. SM01]MDW5442360.1 TauD/TfdA family dioxygenase [Polaromonas sp. SM01]